MVPGLDPHFSKMSQKLKTTSQVWEPVVKMLALEQTNQKSKSIGMALGLDLHFSQMVPKLHFPGLVWELVVKMLRPKFPNRNPKILIWLQTWTFTFQK